MITLPWYLIPFFLLAGFALGVWFVRMFDSLSSNNKDVEHYINTIHFLRKQYEKEKNQ